jgi:hypothetical protein
MEEQEYHLISDINGIRQLKSSIEYLLSVWPGSPARPQEEQIMLWNIKEQCVRCELEHLMFIPDK